MPIAHIGGGSKLREYIPQLYSPELEIKFWHNTVLRMITNSDFEGKFKGKGDRLIVRCPPNVHTSVYVDGGTIKYQEPEAFTKEFAVNRARYYGFHEDSIKKAFSDIPNWLSTWMSNGAKQFGIDVEREAFADLYTKCDSANCGNTAGAISGGYTLGSGDAPLAVFKDDASVTAGAAFGDGVKKNVVEAITEAASCLEEQAGGLGLNPWIVIPVWMSNLIQNSDLKHADLVGDPVSLLRKDAVTSIGKIANMTIYVSNLTPKISATVNSASVAEYPILFGDTSAISFAKEVTETDVIKDKDVPGDFQRSLLVYDWFPRYPTRFGAMIVAKGKAA